MLKTDSLESGKKQDSSLNLAFVVGAFERLGYGESIGKMISREGLNIPEQSFLIREASEKMET